MPLAAALVGGVLPAGAAVARAQTITVQMGDSSRVIVPPGSRLAVPLRVDLTAAGSALNLASLTGTLSWGASRLTFDSIRVNAATGFTQTINSAGAATGSVVLTYFSSARLEGSSTLATAWFTVATGAGGTRVAFTPTVAGSENAQGILDQVVARGFEVCAALLGRWGDVNGDTLVNVLDAQQVARHSVGLTVSNPVALGERGDVTADGAINVLDAQQIARFSVGLSATGRVNQSAFTPPVVAAMSVTPSPLPMLAVGRAVALSPVLSDATGGEVTGCVPVTYSSGVPLVASVGGAGVVTGVAPGTATITATAGSRTASATVVVQRPVAAVTLSVPNATMGEGRTQQLTATVRDSAGATLTGWPVAWSSSDTTRATVSSAGVVTARGAGTVSVTATSGGRSATTQLTVSRLFVLGDNGVTVRCPLANVGETGTLNGVTYTRRSEVQLRELVATRVYSALPATCTTGITSMARLFRGATTFNGDLSSWDVSAVTTMEDLFTDASQFNQPLAAWDVGQVTTMAGMFARASAFNQPIGAWNTGSVTDMAFLFSGARAFNQPLAAWNVSRVVSMRAMFQGASEFDQPLGAWNVAAVTDMGAMFSYTDRFNQDLGAWSVGSVRSMDRMFMGSAFNGDIGRWGVRGVTTMAGMFADATAFNQDIGGWNVSAVDQMANQFDGARAFNQDLSKWCVTKVASAPAGFDTRTPAWTRSRPVWGTCPAR
ncbi:MAG: BspA family leucine-rich repeat surface protein [Gemmatimonadetes bacterium]|nr:BspA family leucine-rich repeat surface protein [Gemmatimonadota bacterium]